MSGKHPGLLHDIYWQTRGPTDVLKLNRARLDLPGHPNITTLLLLLARAIRQSQ